MGEEIQISCAEEFQIIYIHTTSSNRWNITLCPSVDFLPERTV